MNIDPAAAKRGCVIWLTGLPGAGKTTVAKLLEQRLRTALIPVEVLDGDAVRLALCPDLGFSKRDRDENIRRIVYVTELLVRNGVTVIVAAVSPYREARNRARAKFERFAEVYLNCPLTVLEQRDEKGQYARALAGELTNFTGVSDPYEPPAQPELELDTSAETASQTAGRIWEMLESFRPCGASS